MRITIVAIGSRGDVQPYVGLAVGLKAAGYNARLATHVNFREMIEPHGLEFAPVAGDMQNVMTSEAGLRVMDAGNNPFLNIYRLFRAAAPLARAMVQDSLNALADTGAVLGSALGYSIAFGPALKLKLPLYGAFVQPNLATGAFPFPTFPELPRSLPFRRWYNRTTYKVFMRLLWIIASRIGNPAQMAVTGLPPLRFSQVYGPDNPFPTDILFGFSRHVVPRPPEWSEAAHITGYWFLDQQTHWQPPADLQRFLDDGPPPVYIGFGSMSNRNPEQVARLATEALRMTGQRGLLLGGWSGIGQVELPDTIFRVESTPHDWLFPRMAALVHHGGSGTTGAAFRAGIPQIVIPYSFDQPFWGAQTYRMGVGVKPIPRKRLTADKLAKAIDQAIHNADMRRCAVEVGALIRAEDGVGQAVSVIDRLLNRPITAQAGTHVN
ncbi:MAG: glycosyltransferase [Aggregatilineales bacterium]